MASILKMPKVVAGGSSGSISRWRVKVGDRVTEGDVIADIEADKATIEYQTAFSGTVAHLVCQVGEPVDAGAPIAVIAGAGETLDDLAAVLAEESTGQTVPGPEITERPETFVPSPAAAREGIALQTPHSGRLFASPLVRHLMVQHHLSTEELEGSGPNGRIVRRDVERFLERRAEPSTPRVAAPTRPTGYEEAELIPATPFMATMARRLSIAAATIPQFSVATEIRVDSLVKLREDIKPHTKLSITDFLIKAMGAALTDVGEANRIWSQEGLLAPRAVDIGIAVSTPFGLTAPILRDVAAKTLSALHDDIAALLNKARDQQLTAADLSGGTFTLSNLGMYGTREFTALVNPPQAAILAVGQAVSQPVVDEGKLRVGTIMHATLTADHRVLDGVLASRWLRAFTHHIENPLTLLV